MSRGLTRLELLLLAAQHTDLLDFLTRRRDPLPGRQWHCPTCGRITYDAVRQAERNEVCLYVCRQCGSAVDELLPF